MGGHGGSASLGVCEVDPDELRRKADELDASAPDTAITYRVYGGYVAALRPELPALVLEYPDTVFEDALLLDFGNRSIELRWLGRGNTDGDIVVWLPDDRLLVTGDLLVAPIPFAFDSPMVDWSATLRRLREFDAEIIVPGHGALQYGDSHLTSVMALIAATTSRVRAAYENGVTFEDLAGSVDLGDFRGEFAGESRERQWAWQAYFVEPGPEERVEVARVSVAGGSATMMKLPVTVLLASSLVLLCACGGSGGGSEPPASSRAMGWNASIRR